MSRDDAVSSRAFLRYVETELSERLRSRKSELGVESLKVYRNASLHGALSFFLQLTRSYRYTTMLCRILDRAVPRPYRIRYGTLYDAVLQLTSTRHWRSEELDELLSTLRHVDIPASEITVLASSRQYTVYDDQSPGDERKRVNICFLVHRPDGMSRKACQAYWRTRHAELALRNMQYLGLTRYLQVHTVEEPDPRFDDTYDGVVYAEKPSLARLLVELAKPDSFRFNNTVVVDETNFTSATPVMLMRLSSEW